MGVSVEMDEVCRLGIKAGERVVSSSERNRDCLVQVTSRIDSLAQCFDGYKLGSQITKNISRAKELILTLRIDRYLTLLMSGSRPVWRWTL